MSTIESLDQNRAIGRFPRRCAALAASCLLAFGTASQAQEVSQPTYDKSEIVLVSTVINATNPYMASWISGSEDIAEKLGVPLEIVNANGSSQAELAGVQAQAAKGKKLVLVVNPVAASNVPAIHNTIRRNGGYMTVWWNTPPNFTPENASEHYVAFGTYNGVTAGRCGAEHLLEAIGGEGGIIALQGVLDSTVSQERYAGLLATLEDYPDVELLDTQPASWDRQQALNVTQQMISKHGDEINGVWAADDAMMLGAYQAFKQEGRLEEVKFSGEGAYQPTLDIMVEEGQDSPIVATAFHRGYMAAATGLNIAYKAAIGEIDVAEMTSEQRHGQYALDCVTPENAEKYHANNGIPEGWLDRLVDEPFMDLVGGKVEVPDVERP